MSAQLNEEEVDRSVVETNEVLLRGRLSGTPEERVLPSGDTVWTFRVVIGRPREPVAAGSRRARVDTLECAVWVGRVKRSVPTWRDGDVVEVSGALRRRFFKTAGATVSRVEVDVARGKVIRRATTG
ncbi:MAG: single-stranded DNA-binding protein [Actinomycetota bacterium]|nr:single-stranded DNA-binding protein [Actinomycetota bacterium]